MGNLRGNSYSRNHTVMSPSQFEFWNFTFDDMGRYDVPASLNFLTNNTDHDKIIYIGHSMGKRIIEAAEM